MAKSKLINFIKLLVLGGMFTTATSTIAACGGGSGMHDYVHDGSVKLSLSYTGKNFFKDGIGQVDVETYIDGDTTHFTCRNDPLGDLLKTRYYGVDTPESTGAIQPWGKQASNFTHEKLEQASRKGTIVVSSPFSTSETGGAGEYGLPETDSTGSRYLALIWVNLTQRNAPVESLVCLNLWLVQEGFSGAKATGKVPAYEETFVNASNQAEKKKLHIWSDEEDPLFNYGDYQTVSLLDMKHEIEAQFANAGHENLYNNANVRFTGCVSGYINNTLYVQECYYFDADGNTVDPEDVADRRHDGETIREEWAGINVFTGMNPINSEYTKIGAYLEVVGTAVDSENFGFQVSGCTFPTSLKNPRDDECKILIKADENVGVHEIKQFTYANADALSQNIAEKNYENLFCRTIIEQELRCSYAYLNKKGDELTMQFDDCEFSVYVPFTYHGDPENPTDSWLDPEYVIGKTFLVKGVLGHHKQVSGSYKFQIIPCRDSDLLCTSDKEGTTDRHPFTVSEAYTAAPTALEDVNYFVKAALTGAITKSNRVDSYTNRTIYELSFDVTDGTETMHVEKAKLPFDVINEANSYDKDLEADKIAEVLNAHYALYKDKSVILLNGIPSVQDGLLTYTGGTIQFAKLHGTEQDDPITVTEVNAIANALEAGGDYSALYYFEGKINQVTYPYGDWTSGTAKRMSFLIEDLDDSSVMFLVEGAQVDASIADPTNDLVAGVKVLVKAYLIKNANGETMTRTNSCKVLSIIL